MSDSKSAKGARQFSAFLFVGIIAALVNWSSRIALSAAGLGLSLSIVLAYLLGMATAYTLSRLFVFDRSGRSVTDEAWRFALVNVVALIQVWLVTITLQRWGLPVIGWTWHAEEVAHAVGVGSPAITSYLGHQYFTFLPKREKATSVSGVSEEKSPR